MTPEEQQKEVIESRTKKTLIHCPMCAKPIGQRCGDQWWFEKNDRGKKGRMQLTMQQNTPSGSYKIECADRDCNGGHIFVWYNEGMTTSDTLTASVREE